VRSLAEVSGINRLVLDVLSRSAKGIDDPQAFVERGAVLHVLRPKHIAVGVKDRGGNHRVISPDPGHWRRKN
jgi:hypothetical protein